MKIWPVHVRHLLLLQGRPSATGSISSPAAATPPRHSSNPPRRQSWTLHRQPAVPAPPVPSHPLHDMTRNTLLPPLPGGPRCGEIKDGSSAQKNYNGPIRHSPAQHRWIDGWGATLTMPHPQPPPQTRTKQVTPGAESNRTPPWETEQR